MGPGISSAPKRRSISAEIWRSGQCAEAEGKCGDEPGVKLDARGADSSSIHMTIRQGEPPRRDRDGTQDGLNAPSPRLKGAP